MWSPTWDFQQCDNVWPAKAQDQPASCLNILRGFIKEGGGDFPLLLRHVSPATFDLYRVYRQILSNHPPTLPWYPDAKKVNETPDSMNIMLLTELHLEFLSLKRGCTGSSESTHVKMPHCWKSHCAANVFRLKDKDKIHTSHYLQYLWSYLELRTDI